MSALKYAKLLLVYTVAMLMCFLLIACSNKNTEDEKKTEDEKDISKSEDSQSEADDPENKGEKEPENDPEIDPKTDPEEKQETDSEKNQETDPEDNPKTDPENEQKTDPETDPENEDKYDTTDNRKEIVENQLKKAVLVPNISVNTTGQYSIYNRSDVNQRATFVVPAGEEYIKTAFTTAGNNDYANIVIPKGARSLTVTVDGFMQNGIAWNGGGAAIARAGEYGSLYDSGWLDFSAMETGKKYGASSKVTCLERGENHIKYVLDVSAYSRYDLIWNCTFDMKGKCEDISSVHIDLDVAFSDANEEETSALTRIGNVGTGAFVTQGCAVYGDYLFQMHDKMGEVRVYDLKQNKLIASSSMTPVSTYHCNSASFGIERYDAKDEFPLLYVSMENIAEHNVIVLRVMHSGNSFSFTKVQTIAFPSVSDGGYYYPNASVDAKSGKLYCIGYPRGTFIKEDYGPDEFLKMTAYDLPKLDDGNVTLGLGKAIDIPMKTATQGFYVENGILYQVYGLSGGNNYVSVIDCATGEARFDKTLSELAGIGAEPEGIFRYGDDFMVVLLGGEIWRFDRNTF